jgi:hypothetical protein
MYVWTKSEISIGQRLLLIVGTYQTSTSTPQLMPRCTSVMSATSGSAVLKLSSSITNPVLTPQYTSAIGPSVVSMLEPAPHSLVQVFDRAPIELINFEFYLIH